MFLSSRLYYRREMNQLMTFLVVHEVSQTLRPCILKFDQYLDELHIILKLRVDHFDILFVFFKEVSEIEESLLNAIS